MITYHITEHKYNKEEQVDDPHDVDSRTVKGGSGEGNVAYYRPVR